LAPERAIFDAEAYIAYTKQFHDLLFALVAECLTLPPALAPLYSANLFPTYISGAVAGFELNIPVEGGVAMLVMFHGVHFHQFRSNRFSRIFNGKKRKQMNEYALLMKAVQKFMNRFEGTDLPRTFAQRMVSIDLDQSKE